MESVCTSESMLTWKEARDKLRTYREDSSRNSSTVLNLGRYLIQNSVSKLGSEVWSVYEQTCMAALDCGDTSTAVKCKEKLSKQFPGSFRVLRLEGLYLEAKEKYAEAEQLYDNILEKREANVLIRKRKVAVLKAQGKISAAIKELNSLLEVFMSDSECWLELSDLYISLNEYSKAGFCMEELILSNPHHHLYHQRYAEICYSQASSDSFELARKHFATAVKLNPDNMRALYGFTLVNLKGKQKNKDYMDWAKTQLKKRYQFNDEKLKIVKRMLESDTN